MSMDAEQRSICEDRIKNLLDIEDLMETVMVRGIEVRKLCEQ